MISGMNRAYAQGLKRRGARRLAPLFLAFFAALVTVAPLRAQQDSQNRVAEMTDWSVFEDTGPRMCWAVAGPKKTVNTRDGKPVKVRRGQILLMVTYQPDAKVKGQVSFTGGYPFAKDSQVTMRIGKQTFQLFTDPAADPEVAWASSEADDAKIISAMKRGADATLTAYSARGTKTEDTFSLLGFTAAVEDAARRCGN